MKKVLGIFAGAVLALALVFTACDDPPGGPKAGDLLTSSTGMEMVWVPAGTFLMGSPDGTGGINGSVAEPNRQSNETLHSVTLTEGFYMGKYEITQGQYQTVVGNNPSYYTVQKGGGSRDTLPVEMVTWYDAVNFCNLMSVAESLEEVYTITDKTMAGNNITNATVSADFSKNGYRLPTEAEWEYACRAGKTTPFGIGDGTKLTAGMANFYTQYTYDLANTPPGNKDETTTHATLHVGQTSAVGSYSANVMQIPSVHGNVWEWCWDWYDANYGSVNASDPATDPEGPPVSGTDRVVRGGSWVDVGLFLRSAFRFSSIPDNGDSILGFRVVRP